MFFAIDLLCPQHGGRFAVAWIVATRGIRYASRKQIVSCNITKLCNEIIEMIISTSNRPRQRLSLTLATRLANGMVKIYRQQATILLDDLLHSLMVIHKPMAMDLEDSEETPKVKPSRKRKRTIVLSEELPPEIPSARPVPQIPDLEIVIDERELTRPAMHQIDSDLITLREEIPARASDRMYLEGMGEFGVLGDGVQPPFPELPLQPEQLLQQPQVLTADDAEEPPSKKQAVSTVDIVEPQPVLPELPVEIETEIVPQVQSEIQTVAEVPQPEIPEVVELPQPEVQVATTELLKSDGATDLPGAKDQEKVPRKKKLQDFAKILVKVYQRPVVNINRVRPEEKQLFDLWEYENRVPVVLVASRIDDTTNLSVIAPFMEETENFEQFISVVRASLGSRGSLLRPSSSSLQVHSKLNKTAEQSGIPKPSITAPQVPEESHQLIVPVEVHVPAVPQLTPSIEQIMEVHQPILEITERLEVPEKTVIPLAESTGISIRMVEAASMEQPLIQAVDRTIEITARAGAAPQRKDVITNVSPTGSQKLIAIKNRQKRIRNIVKNWDADTRGAITLEAVCFPPINRRNIAVAFCDLLTMHKMGYVVLKTKPDSLELGIIEKGDRIFRKN